LKLRFIPSNVVCCAGVYAEACPARRIKEIIIMPFVTSYPNPHFSFHQILLFLFSLSMVS
jgi:hypothetical protein